ncbi:MAG: hypothetical protein ACXACU_09080 [Candidatus Hodarchaeales archaeon]|jgi:hypothetical protein
MIIKNIWILSKVGLCYYHYAAPFSDYNLDDSLFSGFIAGITTFADTLTGEDKSIEFIKLDEDELYFESIGDLITAAIVTPGDEKIQPFTIKVMLQFIGTKFLDMYQERIEDFIFERSDIKDEFSKEIQNFLHDKDMMEDIKREQFQNLFSEAISGLVPIDLLHWRGVQLFSGSNPKLLRESLNLIENLNEVSTSLISDNLLEAKVTEVLHKLLRDLRQNVIEHNHKKLLIVCRETSMFDSLSKILLTRAITSTHCPSFEYLVEVIESWKDKLSYDILFIGAKVSRKILRAVHDMELKKDTKIIMVVNNIPRPPRGRIIHKKAISFIVQEVIPEFNWKSPLVDYILTFLEHET